MNCVYVKFGQGHTPVSHPPDREDIQSFQKFFGLSAFMCFHIPNYNIDTLRLALVGSFEHGIRLPHTGSIAEENLQFSSAGFFCLDMLQQFIRVRTMFH